MAFNPRNNLKKITSSEMAREYQKRGLEVRKANAEARSQFKFTAKVFADLLKEIPEMSPLDVIKMAMVKALQEDDYVEAARHAATLAEYKSPKLQRIDQTVTSKTSDLSDEELRRIIEQEGLDSEGSSLQ
jgi:hypothetical protein